MKSFDFTHPILTERLTLRPMAAADIDDVHAFQSDADVVRYLLHGVRSRDEIVEKATLWIAATTLAKNGDFLRPVVQLSSGQVIGLLYVKLKSTDDRAAEIGWVLHRDFQGHGYASEAASAMLNLAFGTLGLHRVFAELDPRNTASARLCERLGMRQEAQFVEDLMFKGEWADTAVYGILDREWRAPS